MQNQQKPTDRIKLEFYKNIFSSCFECFLMKTTEEGTFKAKIEWEKLTPEPEREPSFIVNDSWDTHDEKAIPSFFRNLISSLKNNKLLEKTSHFKMLEGELKAKGAHLEDMRVLVFNPNAKNTD